LHRVDPRSAHSWLASGRGVKPSIWPAPSYCPIHRFERLCRLRSSWKSTQCQGAAAVACPARRIYLSGDFDCYWHSTSNRISESYTPLSGASFQSSHTQLI
jgi:hypothetical protein